MFFRIFLASSIISSAAFSSERKPLHWTNNFSDKDVGIFSFVSKYVCNLSVDLLTYKITPSNLHRNFCNKALTVDSEDKKKIETFFKLEEICKRIGPVENMLKNHFLENCTKNNAEQLFSETIWNIKYFAGSKRLKYTNLDNHRNLEKCINRALEEIKSGTNVLSTLKGHIFENLKEHRLFENK